jgi:N-methylhydantoinase B
MTLDPITLEVVNNRLREIVSTMERLLFHSGYSTILRESHDGSACITDPEGGVVMGSGLPIHLFPYIYMVQAVLRAYSREEIQAGDSYIITDPYLGGNFHVPDLGVVTPAFVNGELLAFCASIAHKPDVGGLVPGSSSANSREIFHDGLLLPPVRYWTKHGVVKEIDAILRRNSRLPELTAGDVRAQVGCTHVGAARLNELCEEYGTEVIREAFRRLQASSQRRMQDGLRGWVDGQSEAEGVLDSDGADLDVPIHIRARVVKQGDRVTIDLSRMNPQVRGPVNIRPQAAESAGLIALLNFLDPTIPINDGCRRVISFVNPEGTLSNPRFPATVNNYFPTMHILYSVIMKALVTFNPARAVGAAGFGVGSQSVGYRNVRGRKTAVQYELFVSSLGGTPTADGTPYVLGISHITPYTPIEILETEHPVRVTAFEPIADSGGPGKYRGGPGYRKEYQFLSDATVNLRMTGFRSPAWGVLGGKAPKVGRCTLNPDTPRERVLPPLCTFDVTAGDVVRAEFSGGGGCGDPLEREPSRVRDDVTNGYVSIEGARSDYGVVLAPGTLAMDLEETARIRAQQLADRSRS